MQAAEEALEKVIDVETIATKEDTLVDVMSFEPNGYYVFIRKEDSKHSKVWG